MELAQNVIQNRIENLDNKGKRKAQALKDSESQLQSDDVKLLKFIEKDQLSTHDKERDADRTAAERKAMELVDKDLQTQIANIRSDIEKSKDVVSSLKDHSNFLLGLAPSNWVTQVKNDRTKALEQFKKQWIKDHKEDTRDDHIIFRGDDPVVFSQEALAAYSGALSPHPTVMSQESAVDAGQNVYASPSLGKKGKKGHLPGLGSYGREHMTDKDWEAKFELLMSEDLIDLPDKLREEHLYFDDPD